MRWDDVIKALGENRAQLRLRCGNYWVFGQRQGRRMNLDFLVEFEEKFDAYMGLKDFSKISSGAEWTSPWGHHKAEAPQSPSWGGSP